MRKSYWSKQLRLAVALACFPASFANAQSSTDLSGTYIEQTQDKRVPGDKATIGILQTANQIEFRRERNGNVQVSTFPLDGSPGVYRTETGIQGPGSAHWKDSTLIVESIVAAPPQAGKIIRLHTTEQWQMSKDRQTLKVRVETDSPDMPREIMNAAIQPYTIVYRRGPAKP